MLISDKIQRLAEIKHGGDINKAAVDHFRDHPEDYLLYTAEVTVVNKRAEEDPKAVNAEVEYRLQLRANAMGLDLSKPADRLVATEKVCKEDPALFGSANDDHRMQGGSLGSPTSPLRSFAGSSAIPLVAPVPWPQAGSASM